MTLQVETFFDAATSSLSHLIYDPNTRAAVIVDPVLDFDPAALRIEHFGAKKILDSISANKLQLQWILETHAHADHLSAAHWIKQQTGAPIAIGEGIIEVQKNFNRLYALSDEQAAKPSDFDRLLKDGEKLSLGEHTIEVMATPGHTPSCCTYSIGDCAFVGDTLFMPDFGTARCDFPGGDARQLYRSIKRTLALPDATKLYMCHDYQPGGRDLQWRTTVGEQKIQNIHIHQGISEQDFVAMRTERDKQLAVPKLILPALQINIRAGRLPEPDKDGNQFLKLPLNKL
jgi:glyoxylase-like metal-dependent hydrolase (beta-lactamase superfamily II)